MRNMETFHIRGKVTGDLGENANRPTMLMLIPNSDDGVVMSMFRGFTVVRKDHTFEISNVTPGSYVISLPGINGQKQVARQVVEVGSGDLNDVVVTPQPTFSVHGQVELQGAASNDAKEKGLDGVYVMLRPEDGQMIFGNTQATTKADGTFVIDGLSTGKVRATVFNEPDGSYVKSIRIGNQEILGKSTELSGPAELHVLLHTGAAEVSGTVTAKQGDTVVPVSSASVLLIPEDLTRDGGSLHTANTDQNGNFKEKGLTPGVYTPSLTR